MFGRGLLTAHPGRVVLRLKVTFSPRGGVARSVTVRGVHVPKPRAKPKPKPKPPPIEDLRGAR